MSRWRSVRFLVISLAFVAGGIIILYRNPWVAWESIAVGWATIAFFGFGVIVFAIQVIHPSVLVMDAEGFEARFSFQRKDHRRSWQECSAFSTMTTGATKLVVYTAKTGGDGAVQVGYGGLSADELAALMNRYRDENHASRGRGAPASERP